MGKQSQIMRVLAAVIASVMSTQVKYFVFVEVACQCFFIKGIGGFTGRGPKY